MKLTVSYNAATIETNLTLEDLRKAQRFYKQALSLVNPKDTKDVIFTIDYDRDMPQVSNYGIVFSAINNDGKLFCTECMDGIASENAETRKKLVEEEYGHILYNLKKIEDQVAEAAAHNADMISTIADSIHC